MGAICSQNFCNLNANETGMCAYGKNVYIQKKNDYEYIPKNEEFYKKSKKHFEIKDKIAGKRVSMKNTSTYQNGNVEVVLL